MTSSRTLWLTLTALTLAVAAVMSAAGVILVESQTANREREALIRFVCTAIDIQERGRSPLAAEYRRRFDAILADLGEPSCKEGKETP